MEFSSSSRNGEGLFEVGELIGAVGKGGCTVNDGGCTASLPAVVRVGGSIDTKVAIEEWECGIQVSDKGMFDGAPLTAGC